MFEKAIDLIMAQPPELHYPAYFADLLRAADVPDKDAGDTISRQTAISLAGDLQIHSGEYQQYNQAINNYCAELIKLPSAQPSYTDVEIQKMQDLESAEIEKAYQLGYEEGKKDAQSEKVQLSEEDATKDTTYDCISRQEAIDALYDWSDHSITNAEAWHLRQVAGDIKSMPPVQPKQRYTEEELRVFKHGISLSLLSKRSSQHWQYDEDTATEIKFLERLYEKVSADMRGEQDD